MDKRSALLAAVFALLPMAEASARGGRGHGGTPTDTALLVIGGLVALALVFGFFARLFGAKSITDQMPPTSDWGEINRCPDCGAKMIKRPQHHGVGRATYRCSNYPKCTGIRYQEKRKK
jgi:predicted RNA-binding Zn-ribbon protein involved in translation (DUF1610 family)